VKHAELRGLLFILGMLVSFVPAKQGIGQRVGPAMPLIRRLGHSDFNVTSLAFRQLAGMDEAPVPASKALTSVRTSHQFRARLEVQPVVSSGAS